MRAKLADIAASIGRWSLAHLAIRAEGYLFDYVLYPFMLFRGGEWLLVACLGSLGIESESRPIAGYWLGWCLLTAASVVINYLYIRAYDRLRTDLFGFEALKNHSRCLSWLAPRRSLLRTFGRLAFFVYLSVCHSPLFGTLFIRGPRHDYSMSERDWQTFWLALVIANLGWAGMISAAVGAANLVLTRFV